MTGIAQIIWRYYGLLWFHRAPPAPPAPYLGLALVHFLWQGLAFGLLALLALLVLRRTRPAIRYLTLLVLLALMPVAPVVATYSSLTPWYPPVTYSHAVRRPRTHVLTSAELGQLMAERAKSSALSKADPGRQADSAPDLPQGPSAPSIRGTSEPVWFWVDWHWLFRAVVSVWAAGVLVLTLRLVLQWRALGRVRARAAALDGQPPAQMLAVVADRLRVRRTMHLLESALVEVPAVIGWVRPAILLPPCALTGLTPAQLEAVIAHEVAHVRRHDFLVNILQTVVETLLFYHPVVSWLSHRLRTEREHCCDDLAVKVCGDPVSYARGLVELEQLRSLEPALSVTGGSLASRVRRLLARSPEIRPVAPRFSAALSVPLVALLLLRPVLALTLAASPLDGTLIYVERGSSPNNSGYVMHVLRDGAESVIALPGLRKPPSPGGFSPVTGQVLYSDGSRHQSADTWTWPEYLGIWRANPDGSDAVDLTRVAGLGGLNYQPRWSPDGTMVAFMHDLRAWVMNSDGSGAHLVWPAQHLRGSKPTLSHSPGSWSPDGSRLLTCASFEVSPDGVADNCYRLFTVDVRTGQVRVLPRAVKGRESIWSPDGSMIASTESRMVVVRGKIGGWDQIVLTDANYNRPRLLFSAFFPYRRQEDWKESLRLYRGNSVGYSSHVYGLASLTWSPRGDKIAFLAKTADDLRCPQYLSRPSTKTKWDVFVCDVRTGRTTQVTHDGLAQESIAWWE